MKVQIGQFRVAQDALTKILTEQLPLKTAFRLKRLYKAAQDNLNIIEKQRVELITKMGTRDEESDEIKVPQEKIADFQSQFIELLEEEVEVDYEPISVDDLGDIKLSVVDLAALEPFIEE